MLLELKEFNLQKSSESEEIKEEINCEIKLWNGNKILKCAISIKLLKNDGLLNGLIPD